MHINREQGNQFCRAWHRGCQENQCSTWLIIAAVLKHFDQLQLPSSKTRAIKSLQTSCCRSLGAVWLCSVLWKDSQRVFLALGATTVPTMVCLDHQHVPVSFSSRNTTFAQHHVPGLGCPLVCAALRGAGSCMQGPFPSPQCTAH